MKISYLVFCTVLLFLGSCSNKNIRNTDFFSPLKIEISKEIKEDIELEEIILTSEKSINFFSDNIEQLAIDSKEILEDTNPEHSQKLKTEKLMVALFYNRSQITNSLDIFYTYVENKQAQGLINNAQFATLEQIGITFEKRINQIDNKYKKFY